MNNSSARPRPKPKPKRHLVHSMYCFYYRCNRTPRQQTTCSNSFPCMLNRWIQTRCYILHSVLNAISGNKIWNWSQKIQSAEEKKKWNWPLYSTTLAQQQFITLLRWITVSLSLKKTKENTRDNFAKRKHSSLISKGDNSCRTCHLFSKRGKHCTNKIGCHAALTHQTHLTHLPCFYHRQHFPTAVLRASCTVSSFPKKKEVTTVALVRDNISGLGNATLSRLIYIVVL